MEACKEVINSISAYKFQVKQSKSFTMLRDLEFFFTYKDECEGKCENRREQARSRSN
jgi:hypothetical protein